MTEATTILTRTGNHKENAQKVSDLIQKTLLNFSRPVPQGEAAIEAPPAPVRISCKRGEVVKGFKGRGTAQEPLLIENYHDLLGLERVEVGLEGYYFLQTADIDCTELTTWMNINFIGHFDGGGHTIKYKKIGNDWLALFSAIQEQSSITNLKLENVRLAIAANDSRITHCFSTVTLIKEKANKCKITDCLVFLGIDSYITPISFGCIATTLTQGCVVERCFIAGKVQTPQGGEFQFSAIADNCDASTVRQCAVGRFDLQGSCLRLKSRVVRNLVGPSTLEKNASIDTNPGEDRIDGCGGRTVAEAAFKQHYFEHTLGWDFDTVWQWDDANDRPNLRSLGMCSAWQSASITDLLTQQMSANVWLKV